MTKNSQQLTRTHLLPVEAPPHAAYLLGLDDGFQHLHGRPMTLAEYGELGELHADVRLGDLLFVRAASIGCTCFRGGARAADPRCGVHREVGP